MLPSKRRGRPPGTDYKEDFEALCLVADRIIAEPGLRPSTAMWAVCKTRKWRGQTDQAIVARWLRKWKTQGPAHLEATGQRRSTSEARAVTVGQAQLTFLASFAELGEDRDFQAKVRAISESVRKAVDQINVSLNSPQMSAILEQHRKVAQMFASSPAFKEIQRFQEQMKNLPQFALHMPRRLV
jgi:hypothetical protein